jgi:acyl carrier protein
MQDTILALKKEIIEKLNFEDMTPADIDENAPLFGPDGLGLDSIDALELILILEKTYGVKIDDADEGKTALHSVASMAECIARHKGN